MTIGDPRLLLQAMPQRPGARGHLHGGAHVLSLRRHDKMEALAELGRHFGLFDERTQLAGGELAGGLSLADALAEAAKEVE